jgi:hypothetical protein
MAFLTNTVPEGAEEKYTRQLKGALAEGWIMLSEGPSGAQLELPKKMKTQTKVALVVGFFLLFLFWGLGAIVMIAALIDYAMQKKQTKFISRTG